MDEVLQVLLVAHTVGKVFANDANPGGAVLLVKFSPDKSGSILLVIEVFVEGFIGGFDSVLLHSWGHI